MKTTLKPAPAFGRYKIHRKTIIECLGCGGAQTVKTPAQQKLFRERHFICHETAVKSK